MSDTNEPGETPFGRGETGGRGPIIPKSANEALRPERATRLRELMGAAGLDDRRVARVTGKADRAPVTGNPTAVRNNRIEIVLLRAGRG